MIKLYPILISSIAGFATVLGNILLFIPIKYKDKILSFSFGLSASVMILISIGELIPEGLKLMPNINRIYLFISSLFLLILGLMFINIIDRKNNCKDELYRVGLLSMISILIHNIPEGIICAITSSVDIKIGLKMSLAIMIHNIPEGICICLPIYYATKSKLKSIWLTIVSGGGEVIGAIITMLFLYRFISPLLLYIIFMLTSGIMLSLSINKIIGQGLKLHQYKYFALGIIIGIIIIMKTM